MEPAEYVDASGSNSAGGADCVEDDDDMHLLAATRIAPGLAEYVVQPEQAFAIEVLVQPSIPRCSTSTRCVRRSIVRERVFARARAPHNVVQSQSCMKCPVYCARIVQQQWR